MAELEKYSTLKVDKPLDLGTHQFYKIFLILRNAHVMPRDNDGKVFYFMNYIDWNQFNQLYNPMWQTKRPALQIPYHKSKSGVTKSNGAKTRGVQKSSMD